MVTVDQDSATELTTLYDEQMAGVQRFLNMLTMTHVAKYEKSCYLLSNHVRLC